MKKLSEKTNLIITIINFCITPFLCYLLVETMLHDWCALFPDSGIMCLKYQVANLGVYGGILLILILFTGSFRISGITTYALSMALGLAMYYMIQFRGVALYAADLFSVTTAANVAGQYDYSLTTYQYIGMGIGVVGLVLTALMRGKLNLTWKKRLAMALIGIVLITALYLIYFKWDKFTGIRIKLYNPQSSYQKYGTAYGFVRSFGYLIIETPEGYSVEKAEAIASEYMNNENTEDNEDISKDKPNIIVIMDETLCDLQEIGIVSFKTNKDVFPVLHSLKENTQKGDLHVSRVGGGTAIMEFEMLTGDTNAFLPEGTVAYQTLIKGKQPSLASQLRDDGYEGIIASHPHLASGYNRKNAYPLLGFKQTKFVEDFNLTQDDYIIGQYPSDEAAFKEIICEYEEVKSKTDAPFFAFQVTMQNHTPYLKVENPEIIVEDDFAQYDELQDYLNYMHETDRAIGGLIDYFKECEEPTLIVIFGDHPPRFEDDFYERLIMDGKEGMTSLDLMKVRQTPLYLWANYDIEEKDIGTLSPDFISGYITKAAGIEETGYQKYLTNLHEDILAINSLGYWAADGKHYSKYNKDSKYWEEVNDYSILQYNNLIDTKNRIKGFFE